MRFRPQLYFRFSGGSNTTYDLDYDIKTIVFKPTKQITLTWKGVSAVVKDKLILNNSEGYCQPGEMLAIMGPSGAGKTTLLSLLSKRNNPSLTITGEITANNREFNQQSFYSFGAFVYQNDLLFETLTVRETLEFAANMKIPSRGEALEEIKKLLDDFELQKTENTYVGGQILKGLSGGEKKRLCIAIEMVSKPSVLILDEPTSGLDSNKAARVLSILKKLASHGHTIVFTLHQPSYLQYIKLDRLILLSRGETVYQGPAKEIVPYMQSLGITISKTSTISDFFMLQISESKKINQNYETPLNYETYSQRLSLQINEKIDELKLIDAHLDIHDVYMASFGFSMSMLLKREWTTFKRDRMKFGAMILNTVMKFLLVGILFMDVVPSREAINADPVNMFRGIQSIAFLYVPATVMPSLNTVALTIPLERELFYKQADSKKYSTLPYYLSKIIIFLISNLVSSLIFCLSAYWINGWTNDFNHWVNFTLIIFLLTANGCAIGFFCAALFKQIGRVTALTNIVLMPIFILAGLFNKLTSMPKWISWLQYLSPYRYGFQLIMQNEYRDEIYGLPDHPYNYQEDLGYTLNYTENFVILFVLTFGFYFMGYLLLRYNKDKVVA